MFPGHIFPGHIVLVDTKSGLIPGAIKFFTGSQFSHSLITMPPLLDFPMCIEAVEGGVDMARFDTNYANNQTVGYQVWSINLPESVKQQALQSVINDLECGYGFLEYPWFAWRALNKLFGRDIKAQNNWNNDGMICSKLCVGYLTACGLDAFLAGYGKGSIAPQDLSTILQAHPEMFSLEESVRL